MGAPLGGVGRYRVGDENIEVENQNKELFSLLFSTFNYANDDTVAYRDDIADL